jgi:glycosyltransferase involved in cell wall biosynthesis
MTAGKKILFVCPYPPGQSPSQRFRFEQYFQVLRENGFSFSVHPFLDEATWQILYRPGNAWRKLAGTLRGFGKRLVLLFSASSAGIIFIHREATPVGPPVVEFVLARILKKKIIYDFDDAIWLPDPGGHNAWLQGFKWHRKVRAICRWSYAVSCGNDYLADYARQFNARVRVNPTTLDTEGLHNPATHEKKKNSDLLTIGWTGTHSTLKYLEPLAPVLAEIEALFRGKVDFVVIADEKPRFALPSLRFVRWTRETEIDDLLKIDIGIMPLVADPWANGKCGFKALQYMALEIPAVASPVGVTVRIIDPEENGYLPDTLTDWKSCLAHLIQDATARKKMGEKGRKKVVAHYSLLSNAANFLSLFE